jgi:hypothetical protein
MKLQTPCPEPLPGIGPNPRLGVKTRGFAGQDSGSIARRWCRHKLPTRRDSPSMTLGRPLVSPGFAGCHVPVDRSHRRARPR